MTQDKKIPLRPVSANLTVSSAKGELVLTFSGRLDSETTAAAWQEAVAAWEKHAPRMLRLEASRLEYCDGTGVSLLYELRRRQLSRGGRFEIQGLKQEFERLLDLFEPHEFDAPEAPKAASLGLTVEIGRETYNLWLDIKALITFVGELSVGLVNALLHPGQVRWKDAFRAAESTGVNALPIVALISFLVGLIMAFQAAIPMSTFGATIYVADLIGLSMVRELGPLMTAIVLAGRSGSAFAAELGTMKVNEEIDALTTMGLDPVKFLVVPRVLAAVFMTPLLSVFANVIGIAGGAVVVMQLGFPLIAFHTHVVDQVDYVDFMGGLVKAFVFGILIAGIGCLRGLQTGTGASAVGDSTTSAVVSSIILIVFTDAVFGVVYFYLGI